MDRRVDRPTAIDTSITPDEIDYGEVWSETAFPRELARGPSLHCVNPTVVGLWPISVATAVGSSASDEDEVRLKRQYTWCRLVDVGEGLHASPQHPSPWSRALYEVLPTTSPLHLFFLLEGRAQEYRQEVEEGAAMEFQAWAYLGVNDFIDLCLQEMKRTHGTDEDEFEVVALEAAPSTPPARTLFHMRLVFRHPHHMFATLADVRSMATRVIDQAYEEMADPDWPTLLVQSVYSYNDTPHDEATAGRRLPRSAPHTPCHNATSAAGTHGRHGSRIVPCRDLLMPGATPGPKLYDGHILHDGTLGWDTRLSDTLLEPSRFQGPARAVWETFLSSPATPSVNESGCRTTASVPFRISGACVFDPSTACCNCHLDCLVDNQ